MAVTKEMGYEIKCVPWHGLSSAIDCRPWERHIVTIATVCKRLSQFSPKAVSSGTLGYVSFFATGRLSR